jgi:hypothetical protein
LVRTNGIALVLSRLLHEQGVAHELRAPAEQRLLPGWLAKIEDDERATITMTDLAAVAPIEYANEIEVLFNALRRAGAARGNLLGAQQFADVLEGNPPDELFVGFDRLIVSTVHRAKGLEFRAVLLVPFEVDVDDWLSECRAMFVALTRPTDEILLLDPPDIRGLRKHRGRWVKGGFRGQRVAAIEVMAADTCAIDPTGITSPSMPVIELANYLSSAVQPGDAVHLELIEAPQMIPQYRLIHNEREIGRTSDTFGRFAADVGGRNAPTKITGLFVNSLSTIALSSNAARRLGSARRLVPSAVVLGLGDTH